VKIISVIGGANMDIIARANDALIPGDSTRGVINESPGGVGRNIADNLARIGLDVHFMTVLGNDNHAQAIKQSLQDHGATVHAQRFKHTPRYLAVENRDGEMIHAINDMAALETFEMNHIKKHHDILFNSEWIVLDCNVPTRIIEYVLTHYENVIVEGVSTGKIQKLRPYLSNIHTLKCNQQELSSLLDMPVNHMDEIRRAVDKALQSGIQTLALTMGDKGACLATNTQTQTHKPFNVDVQGTTGAGDAFTAGLVYGMVHGQNPIKPAMALAGLTLKHAEAVNKTLTQSMLETAIRSL